MSDSALQAAVQTKGLKKSYTQGGKVLEVLKGIDLKLFPGEVVALVGESGSGKSTLLQLLGLLDTPTAGQIYVDNKETATLSDEERSRLRRHQIGFVYQFHHLLPQFTALENIMLSYQIMAEDKQAAKREASSLLAKLNLASRANHRPSQLSGGEQQRVAILRALAGDPLLLLADEPTGNLDEKTADLVFEELLTLARENKTACLIATHSLVLAKRMDRILCLQSGVLKES